MLLHLNLGEQTASFDIIFFIIIVKKNKNDHFYSLMNTYAEVIRRKKDPDLSS